MALRTLAVPSSDRAFRRVVETLARAAESPEELAERLRITYPNVHVLERGLSSEPRVFYVYRDGRFEPSTGDAWWAAPDVAHADIHARTGRFVAVCDQFLDLFGTTVDAIVGRSYHEFLLPEAEDAAQAILASMVESPEVRSEVLVRLPDGRTLPLEFHAERHDDLIRVHYRPKPAARTG